MSDSREFEFSEIKDDVLKLLEKYGISPVLLSASAVISKERYDELAQGQQEVGSTAKVALIERGQDASLVWQIQLQRRLTLEDVAGIEPMSRSSVSHRYITTPAPMHQTNNADMDHKIDLGPLKVGLVTLVNEKYNLWPIVLGLTMKIPAEQFEQIVVTGRDRRAGKTILLSLTDADIQCSFTIRSQQLS